ncbi:hypothetical protein Lsan_3455 [Legionella santicrucis]|uniref:Uncharacterized protein n=1 Tax=Legionella santicrucis TaxID=45074 RepID=A0A0W0YDR1_9GAMM|nr:hypothetical protein [Legionella santicrucis]KTD54675.1 hypothetical protein Lsan_3455 [Legionella santicrucis]
MKSFFDKAIIRPDSVVVSIIPDSNMMVILDSNLEGGDKFTYALWMDLATRNPGLMMQSIPVPRGTNGHFQFTVTGNEAINSVIDLMSTSRVEKHQNLAHEIKDRYSFYFDGKSISPK